MTPLPPDRQRETLDRLAQRLGASLSDALGRNASEGRQLDDALGQVGRALAGGALKGALKPVGASLVARQNGVNPNQLFTWRRLAAQGALTATGAEEEVVPASDYRALQNQVRELQRLLGKTTLEAEILKEALDVAAGPQKGLLRSLSLPQAGSR